MQRKDFINRSQIQAQLKTWAETHPKPSDPTNELISWIQMTPRDFYTRSINRASFLRGVVDALQAPERTVYDYIQAAIEANLRSDNSRPVREDPAVVTQLLSEREIVAKIRQAYAGGLQRIAGVVGVGLQIPRANQPYKLSVLVQTSCDKTIVPKQLEGVPVVIRSSGGFVQAQKKSE